MLNLIVMSSEDSVWELGKGEKRRSICECRLWRRVVSAANDEGRSSLFFLKNDMIYCGKNCGDYFHE